MLLDFVDKGFDLKRISYYRLSIQISLSGFSFCITDVQFKKHVVLREHAYKKNVSNYNVLSTEVGDILTSDPLLQAVYPVCECIYVAPQSTLIPDSFFTEHTLRSFLDVVQPLEELDEIYSTRIEALQGHCIFTFPSPVATVLKNKFQQIRFFNQAVVLLHTALQKQVNHSVSISFYHDFMNAVVVKDGQVALSNAFDTVAITDVLYYLTALIQKMQLPPDAGYFVSGEIKREEIEQLSSYYPTLEVENNHRMSLLIGYERSYRYNSLLMLNECV